MPGKTTIISPNRNGAPIRSGDLRGEIAGKTEDRPPQYYYDPERKKRILLSIFAVTVLSSALFLIVFVKYIRPNMAVTVQTGSRKFCPADKKYYDERIEEKKVPRKDKELYRVKTIKACPPWVIAGDGKPSARRNSARYVAHGKPAIGMTRKQVISAWGEPQHAEHWLKGDGVIERLYFGDPLYGLFVSDRYADFKGGVLVNFSTDTLLEKLYIEIMEQRREFSGRQGGVAGRAEQDGR